MDKTVLTIGKFDLAIPNELMFDVATLKLDLRPAINNLRDVSRPPVKRIYKKRIGKHEHNYKSYYSKMKCSVCGLKKRKYRSNKSNLGGL